MTTQDDESQEYAFSPQLVLLVEDDTEIGNLLVDVFKTETTYQALHVTDANRALETVSLLIPDLFLLDYRLPGMNGLELADRLQADDKLKHIPVVFLSAHLPKHELEKRSLTLVKKPFDLDELLQTVEKILNPQEHK